MGRLLQFHALRLFDHDDGGGGIAAIVVLLRKVFSDIS